jgi:hypothetical protein
MTTPPTIHDILLYAGASRGPVLAALEALLGRCSLDDLHAYCRGQKSLENAAF